MKIYVVVPYFRWEGYGTPVEAFSTQEAAEEFVGKKVQTMAGDDLEIVELEVDA